MNNRRRFRSSGGELGTGVLFDGTVSPNGYSSFTDGWSLILGNAVYSKSDQTTYFQVISQRFVDGGSTAIKDQVTLNTLDLTSYTNLNIDYEYSGATADGQCVFAMSVGTDSSARAYNDTIAYTRTTATVARTTTQLSIVNANGNYYVKFEFGLSTSNNSNITATLKIYKIWLT